MSDSKFIWVPDPDPSEWDELVVRSPQGNLFCERLYLELAGVSCRRYVIKQGNRIKAGVSVLESDDGSECRLDDLVIHNGLLYLPDPNKKPVRLRFEQFELAEFAIDHLVGRYDALELALVPQFEDMRPFLWHEYHNPDPASRFALDLRYTLYVEVASLAAGGPEEESAAFEALETLRQRHCREARRQGGRVVLGGTPDLLISFYREMMYRQGVAPEEDKLQRMSRVVAGLQEAGRGALFHVLDGGGAVVYAVAYGWDTKRAYYLFGAGHPDNAPPWRGTLAHWGAFMHVARHEGIKEVDMEGVNSPNRGWFKMGFGGSLKPYYEVRRGRYPLAERPGP